MTPNEKEEKLIHPAGNDDIRRVREILEGGERTKNAEEALAIIHELMKRKYQDLTKS